MTTPSMHHPHFEQLRGAAIVVLLVYHASLLIAPRATLEAALLQLAHAGWLATDIFLAIAGFLCVQSVRRAKQRGGLARSLGRRALRALPSYYAFLLLYLHAIPAALALAHVEGPSVFAGPRPDALAQASLFTLTANLYFAAGHPLGMALEPLFSLSLGAQLLVVIGCALYLSPERRWPWLLGAALVFACALRALWLHDSPWRIYASTVTRCDAFVLGAAAACALGYERSRAALQKHRSAVFAALSLALALQFLFFDRLRIDRSATVLVGYPLVGLWCAALVTLAALRSGTPRTPSLASLAPVVLCIYLVKLPVEHAIAQGLAPVLDAWGAPGHAGLALVMVSAAALAGVLLHRAVERPLRASLKRAGPMLP